MGPLSASVTVETGWEHARIVQDQQVVGPQQFGEFAKASIVKRPIGKPPIWPTLKVSMQVEQARSRAVGQRLLRNALGRQIVLEIRDEHRGDYRVCGQSPHPMLRRRECVVLSFLCLYTILTYKWL
jgi:hypothetical protein